MSPGGWRELTPEGMGRVGAGSGGAGGKGHPDRADGIC